MSNILVGNYITSCLLFQHLGILDVTLKYIFQLIVDNTLLSVFETISSPHSCLEQHVYVCTFPGAIPFKFLNGQFTATPFS